MSQQTDELIRAAREVLRGNDAGRFTRPGPKQYPHQWNWDSALIALGLSYFDLPRALKEIRSLLSGQWRDGMLPHVVYHDQPSDYFPDPAFWKTETSPQAPDVTTSGITQPPLLATVIRRIHRHKPILDFVAESYPALLRWHRWLHTARDADGSGLVCILHPWESGTDDSPRWLEVMARIDPAEAPEFKRGDTRHVSSGERPLDDDYLRFIYLIDLFRGEGYDPASLLTRSPFLVQDVCFNAILYRADQDLKALGDELGEPTHEIDDWLAGMRDNFDKRFWDDGAGLYFDYDLRLKAPIRINTGLTFMSLYAGLASPEQARRLIEEHLRNTNEYAPDDKVRYTLTSTSKSEPSWEPRRYWRGPVWTLLNWLISEGLLRYGFDEEAENLRSDSLELMAKSGFREYYDPRDGSGCGSEEFSWSAAIALDWTMGESQIDLSIL